VFGKIIVLGKIENKLLHVKHFKFRV